jgi:hypothetical protein
MEGWTPSTASQWAVMEAISGEQHAVILQSRPTGKAHITRHLGQRRVDDLLKIDLLVIDVEQRLARAEASLAIAQRTGRFVTVERLDVEHLQRL